jgi:hypothetical protein
MEIDGSLNDLTEALVSQMSISCQQKFPRDNDLCSLWSDQLPSTRIFNLGFFLVFSYPEDTLPQLNQPAESQPSDDPLQTAHLQSPSTSGASHSQSSASRVD